MDGGLLRAPLTLAPHLPSGAESDGRREKIETKKDRDTQLPFLGDISLPIREEGGVEKTLVPDVSESRDSR